MATSVMEDVAGGYCGSMVGDIETRRICCSCVARAGKRKEIPAEGAEGAGAGPSQRPTKKKGGSVKASCGARARVDINGKLDDILKLIDAKVSYAQIADRFKCSVRFLATVKSDRKKIEAAAAAGAGSQKTARKAEFQEVPATVQGGFIPPVYAGGMPLVWKTYRSVRDDTSTTILDGRSLAYTCNLSTGETKVTVYEDQEWSDFYLSTGGTGSCSVADIFDDDDGDVCLEEEACSSNETCTDDEPIAISPNAFNVVAARYSDDKCTVPTGVDHVVSGCDVSASGFSTEGCFHQNRIQREVQLEYHTNFTPHMSSGPDMRRMADAADSCYLVGDYYHR
ncbi:unnamed protein product [Ectocarpus sp. CCAP 1310/34]|nr:unnamed protein product [Ectocarpus sp. CCAP 1310/34]